jgi:PAS domain S-box-containing protein
MKDYSLAVFFVTAAALAGYAALPLVSQFPAVLPALLLVAVVAAGRYGSFPSSLVAVALSAVALAGLLFLSGPSELIVFILRIIAFIAAALATSILIRTLRDDRSSKRQAEADLRATNERLSMILGSISESFLVLDREWRIQYANDRILTHRGLPWSEIQGRSLWDIYPEAEHTHFKPGYEKVMRERVPHSFDVTYPQPDGSIQYFEVHAFPTPNGLSALVADVTERRKTENDLIESRRLLGLVLDSAGVGTWIHDLATNQLLDLGNTDALLGLQGIATIDQFFAVLHPDDRPAVDRAIDQALHTGRLITEHRILRPDGAVRRIRATGAVLRDLSGQPAKIAGVITDITERTRAEEARARLAAIVDSSDDAIISKDLNGTITSWNAGAVSLFGYTPEEIIGKSILTLIPPELHSEEVQILEKLRNGRKIEHYETQRIARNGSRIDVALSISPIRDSDGRIIGAAKIARDITEKTRMQQAIIESEKLAATGRMAAAIAHEINNPLEAVTNLAFLLSTDSSLSESGKKYAALMLEEINRVSHVTKQSLAFFRDNAKPGEFDVGALLDSVLILNRPLLERKQIQVIRSLSDACLAWGSALEMRQVFANLIRNAIEALAPGGSLQLRVRATRSGLLRVSIADNGHGIPPDTLARLFQPFVTSKGVAGNGLGLWVSSGIVKKHHGTIRVRTSSRPGHSGTVFSIVLPAFRGIPAKHPILPAFR